MVRITNEIKENMVKMRKAGSTYPQICDCLGVTKERCIAYLKDIKPDRSITSASTNEWQAAEIEAKFILQKMGFAHIHNLNNISSCTSSWDYLAEKEKKWWLIDVTINGQKSIPAKRETTVDGYEHAILLKQPVGKWKLIKLIMSIEADILMTRDMMMEINKQLEANEKSSQP